MDDLDFFSDNSPRFPFAFRSIRAALDRIKCIDCSILDNFEQDIKKIIDAILHE
ncbi:MAG: hypothetical protein ACLFMZ_11210 [Spirochaetaceae bacterium]